MAERRMFAKTIIDSDAFLDMPTSSQALYFHLSMRADDDGFINSPKNIQRMIGASADDANILLAKKFILAFNNGIVVVKHWRIHNYIQKDRYTETKYKEEKSALFLDENNSYTLDTGRPITEKPERTALVGARKKRADAKKESDLPSHFENTIRNKFIGEKCPLCQVTMSMENNTCMPTVQHNTPISLGGKHHIDNISVICRSCNTSMQNKVITGLLNNEKVKYIWGNVSGMYPQVRLGKSSLVKASKTFVQENEFDIFWSAYPKKVGKDKALESWKKVKPSLDDVMYALSWQRKSKDWTKNEGQYIPMPATYLNQGRWKDEQPITDIIPF